MEMIESDFHMKGLSYKIRPARLEDAGQLSQIRLKIDSETENLDREPGEAFIDTIGFERLIQEDTENERNLFLVAVADGCIVGFSRCEGNELKRFAHKVEFGVGVLKVYWGYGIGKNLLSKSIKWADRRGIAKMTLSVLETNKPAIHLYEKLGFKTEGVLVDDKRLSDGCFYNTVVMGRGKRSMKIDINLLEERDAKELLEFERRNRTFFEQSVPGRGEAYYNSETFQIRHRELLDEQTEGVSRFYLIRNDIDQIMGRINLVNINLIDQEAELGFRIGKEFTGKGIGREAVSLLLTENLGLKRISAKTTISNFASQKILEYNGFRRLAIGSEGVELNGDQTKFVHYILEI